MQLLHVHKKRRTQTCLVAYGRSGGAFSRLQILACAGMALYNKTSREHTSHGEGASDGCRPKLHRWPFSVLSLVSPPIPLEASPVFMCLPWRPAGRTQRRMPPRCKPTHHRYPDRRGWKRSRGLGTCQAIGPGYHTPVSPCQQAFFLVWWASSPVFPMRYCLLDFHTLTNHLLQGMPPHPEACFLRLTLLDSFSPVSYHGLVSLHAPLFRRETLRDVSALEHMHCLSAAWLNTPSSKQRICWSPPRSPPGAGRSASACCACAASTTSRKTLPRLTSPSPLARQGNRSLTQTHQYSRPTVYKPFP